MANLRDGDEAARSEGARAMGSARTPRKRAASQDSLAKARAARWADPEARQRFGDAIRAAAAKRRAEKSLEDVAESS